jgi:hypothetical protein
MTDDPVGARSPRPFASTEEAILGALHQAAAATPVVEVSGVADRFAFSHALIRTTLYEELTSARRRACTGGCARPWRN